jgi:ATP-dependent protease HslVU (ClpYQ) ATPase subunit
MAKTETRVRTRERSIDLGDADLTANEKLEQLIVSVYQANLAKNKAENDYKKKRAELLGVMKDRKLQDKLVEFTDASGKVMTLQSLVETGTSEKADVQKLYGIVGLETFMKIVSATKTAIVDLAGAAVFEQVKQTVVGEENVSVKPYKK